MYILLIVYYIIIYKKIKIKKDYLINYIKELQLKKQILYNKLYDNESI